ncbi:hypothetical protein MMC25_002863 [Agyrium rufum]|nr:hypothetical protein [Agyrium rufum]
MATEEQTTEPLLSSEDRIAELSDIDDDVVKLLEAAGKAIKALNDQSSGVSETEMESMSIASDGVRSKFTKETAAYFKLLSSIEVRIRRNIFALEESGIVSSKSSAKDAQFIPESRQPARSELSLQQRSSPLAGGLGALDVGWLNGRNSNVGKDVEVGLWSKVSQLVAEFDNGVDLLTEDNMETDRS